MKRIVRLTEADLARIVKRVIREQEESFELKSGMKGLGYMQDEAEGKTYVVAKVNSLPCGVTEVVFKNIRGMVEYGYFNEKPTSNEIDFRRSGEGVKSTNPCSEFDSFGNFGSLRFS
jgi:hypothetical protein